MDGWFEIPTAGKIIVVDDGNGVPPLAAGAAIVWKKIAL